MTTTLTREVYQPTEMAPDDPVVTGLSAYIDGHQRPGSREFVFHTLAGLAGVDKDLLESGASSATLIRRRESIYSLACSRLETASPIDIAAAVDQFTSALGGASDLASLEVARTLSVIKPSNTLADYSQSAVKPSFSFADRLSSLPPSSRVIRGLVMTATAASLAVGIAPHAAAETLNPSQDERKTIDAAQPQPSSEPVQTEIGEFLTTAFDDTAQPSAETPAPPPAEAPPAATTKEVPAAPAAAPPAEAYYWKQFDSPPLGRAYHRSGNVPYAFENSPAGIKYADKHGYKRIDLDLQVTKDGVVVVTHTKDPLQTDRIWGGFKDTAGKIKNRNIEIKDLTFKQVRRLKHKDGHRIYSLEHMIGVAAKTDLSLFLELKTPKLLKRHLPEIAAMLNEVKMEAVIAGITTKDGQRSALARARKLGFWTRDLTKDSWSKPIKESKKRRPSAKPPKASDDGKKEPTKPSPTPPNPPIVQEPAPEVPIESPSLPQPIDKELDELFDDDLNTPADTPPTDGDIQDTPKEPSPGEETGDAQAPVDPPVPPAPEVPIESPSLPQPIDKELDELFDDDLNTPADTPPTDGDIQDTPKEPSPGEETGDAQAPVDSPVPPAPEVEEGISEKTAKAADELVRLFASGDEAKIQEEFEEVKEEFGDIGALFVTFDVIDTPQSELPPVAEPTPDPGDEPKDDKGRNRADNDKKKDEKKDDEEKQKQTPKYDKLLTLIASFEGGGNYDAYFSHADNHEIKFTSMKVGDVLAWQREYVNDGSPSSAVGNYQFIMKTLEALITQNDIPKDQIFDKALQDKLAIILLKQRGLNDYLDGDLSDEGFAHNLSKEWASLPSVKGKNPNASYYDGDGLNKAHVTVKDLLQAVRSIKPGTAEKAKDRKAVEKKHKPSSRITHRTRAKIDKSAANGVKDDIINIINTAIEGARTYPVGRFSNLGADSDIAKDMRKAGYNPSSRERYDCLKNVTTWLRVTADPDFNAKGFSTTGLYHAIKKHGAEAVGGRKYKIIYSPSQKELEPGDILLGPGHAALYTGAIEGKDGRIYGGIEAAYASNRVASFRDADQMFGWMKNNLSGLVAIRLVK